MYGVGLPGVVMVVVTVTTIVTTLKLRKAAVWRSETSSGTLSSREVALTKMLIGSSILFIVCLSPTFLAKLVMFVIVFRCIFNQHRCSAISECCIVLYYIVSMPQPFAIIALILILVFLFCLLCGLFLPQSCFGLCAIALSYGVKEDGRQKLLRR